MKNLFNFNDLEFVRVLSLGISSLTTFLIVPFIYIIVPSNEANLSVVVFYQIMYIVGIMGVIIYNVIKIENYNFGKDFNFNTIYLFVIILLYFISEIVAISILLFLKIGLIRTTTINVETLKSFFLGLILYVVFWLSCLLCNITFEVYDYIFIALLFVVYILNSVGYSKIWIPLKITHSYNYWQNISFRLSIDLFYFVFAMVVIFSINNFLTEPNIKATILKLLSVLGIGGFIVTIFESKILGKNIIKLDFDEKLFFKMIINALISFVFVLITCKFYLNFDGYLIYLVALISFCNVISGFLLTVFRRNSSQNVQLKYSLWLLLYIIIYLVTMEYFLFDGVTKIILLLLSIPVISIFFFLLNKDVQKTIIKERN